ncbi:uncharacterized protein [Aquarana catesbeiana]|uniref:uncharacterized protein isoform X2 n=1 Tax=Aquarana catesbeiana TaxID=8400 RepID=UPI003CC9C3B4
MQAQQISSLVLCSCHSLLRIMKPLPLDSLSKGAQRNKQGFLQNNKKEPCFMKTFPMKHSGTSCTEEPEEVSVVFSNDETVEHLLNVGLNSNWFWSEVEQNSSKAVVQIKPCEKDIVEGNTFILST